MYIMCVCLFSTLSHRVSALQISIIIVTIMHHWFYVSDFCSPVLASFSFLFSLFFLFFFSFILFYHVILLLLLLSFTFGVKVDASVNNSVMLKICFCLLHNCLCCKAFESSLSQT